MHDQGVTRTSGSTHNYYTSIYQTEIARQEYRPPIRERHALSMETSQYTLGEPFPGKANEASPSPNAAALHFNYGGQNDVRHSMVDRLHDESLQMGLSPKQLRQLTQNMHVQDRTNQLYKIPPNLRVPTEIGGRHSTIPNLPQITKQLTSPKKYRVANPRVNAHYDPNHRQEAGDVSVNTASLEKIKSPLTRGYDHDLSPTGFRSPAAQIRGGPTIMAEDMSSQAQHHRNLAKRAKRDIKKTFH